MNNPNCTVCHQLLDPIAGSYQNFGDFGWYRDQWGGSDSLAESYKYEDGTPYVEGDTWYRDMRTPGFEDQIAPSSANSLQWLAQQITQDSRFASSAVKFWWPALTGEQPLVAPENTGDARYSELNAAFVAQSAFINQLATSLANHWDMKQIMADILVSPWYRANRNSNQLAQGQSETLAGTERLLSPEALNDKTKLLTGRAWNQEYQQNDNEAPYSSLTGEYRLSYGGIDSDGITERATEMTSVMSQIALAHAVELSCPIVVADFFREDGQRYLFNGITKTTTPGEVVQALHNIHGLWAQGNSAHSTTQTLEAGQHLLKITSTNNIYVPERELSRNLTLNKVRVLDSNNNLIIEMQATEHATTEDDNCGNAFWNELEDSQESSDWHMWGDCALEFPLAISTAGSYNIVVEAYQVAWDSNDQVFQHNQGPGILQLNVEVADPIAQNSDSGETIKQKLAELHFALWGEKVAANSAEVQETYALFVASWNTHKTDNVWNHITERAECSVRWSEFRTEANNNQGWRAGLDPRGTLAAWKTVLAYMLSDYNYLHE